MKLRLANPQDSELLSTFYREFPLAGPLTLEVTRPDDFFSFYNRLATNHRTYILEGDNIEGVAGFIILERLILGQKTKMAYALDFRIKKSRRAIREWSGHFQPVLERIREEEGCEYFFTSLHRSQVQAYNAFVRPRQARRQMPRYHLFRQFKMVSIHGRWPLAPAPLESLTYRKATLADQESLVSYLTAGSKDRPVQALWDEEFAKAETTGIGSRVEDFYLALTENGQIVGCAAPHELDPHKFYSPLTYSSRADNFRQILKLGSLLGYASSLPKPAWKNLKNPYLKFKVISHLRADQEDIFDSLMTFIWSKKAADEFFVYCHFEGEYWLKPSHWMVTTTQKFSLYNVIPAGLTTSLPAELTPIDESSADIDLVSLVY